MDQWLYVLTPEEMSKLPEVCDSPKDEYDIYLGTSIDWTIHEEEEFVAACPDRIVKLWKGPDDDGDYILQWVNDGEIVEQFIPPQCVKLIQPSDIYGSSRTL